jgi:outer membrane protein TolC
LKMDEIKKQLQQQLERAIRSRSQYLKRVNAGASHETHLAYADGLVSGLETAIQVVQEAMEEQDNSRTN